MLETCFHLCAFFPNGKDFYHRGEKKMQTSPPSTNCSFKEQELRMGCFSSLKAHHSAERIWILFWFFLSSGAVLGFVLVNFNLKKKSGAGVLHSWVAVAMRLPGPQQMATGTVLRRPPQPSLGQTINIPGMLHLRLLPCTPGLASQSGKRPCRPHLSFPIKVPSKLYQLTTGCLGRSGEQT